MSDYLAQINKIRALLKGPPGVGKSYLMASLSRLCPMLIIDCEGGLASAKQVVSEKNLDIRVIRPPSAQAFRKDPDETFFRPLGATIAEALKEDRFQAIGIDSFSEVAAMMRDQYSNREGAVGVQDWQKVVSRVRGLSRMMVQAPKHVVITTMTKPVGGDDSGGPKAYEPALPGVCANEVPGMFDLVGMIGTSRKGNEVLRNLTTTGPQTYGVRDRNNILAGTEVIDKEHPEEIWKRYIQKLTGSASKEEKE